MNREDIISMAQEADGHMNSHAGGIDMTWKGLERFAALVAAAAKAEEREQGQKWFDAVTAQHKQEILAEREACAKHAEDFLTKGRSPFGRAVGDAIRARGESK